MCIFIPTKTDYLVYRHSNKNTGTNYFCIYNYYNLCIIPYLKVLIGASSISLTVTNLKFQKNLNFDFNKFLGAQNTLVTKKIKFSGKGYKFVKKDLCFKLLLNTSHEQWLVLFRTIPLKINKQKYLLLSLNTQEVNKTLKTLTNTRPINIYTRRGLRSSKQLVLKKVGKRSV